MTDDRQTTTDAITYLRFKLDKAQRDDDLPDVAVSVDADTLALALAELDASVRARAKLETVIREATEAIQQKIHESQERQNASKSPDPESALAYLAERSFHAGLTAALQVLDREAPDGDIEANK